MTDHEMQRMQQEAVRRTQEMQRRAAAYHRPAPPEAPAAAPVPSSPSPAPQTAAEKAVPEPVHKPPDSSHAQQPVSGGIFEMLFKDKEKTLILGILLLLMDEKTDNSLLMALMYLLI